MSLSRIKDDRKSLFTSQIPLRRSYILSDFLVVQQSNSNNNNKLDQNFSSHLVDLKKSIMSGSKIMFPGPKFLLKKLKRIIYFHLRSIFRTLKRPHKIIINLNLVKLISPRLLSCAFFNIKASLQSYKELKIQKKKSKNKKTHLIFHAIYRMIRNKYKAALQPLFNFARRNKYRQHFLGKLDKAVNDKIKRAWLRIFIRQIKRSVEEKEDLVCSCKKIHITTQQIKRRLKLFAWSKIIQSLKIIQHEFISQQKKLIQMKQNQTQMQKVRALMNERKKLRGMKTQLEIFSTDTSKTRYGIRRDLNVYRNKIKDQEKRAKKQIEQLNNEIEQLSLKLAQISKISQNRLFRIQLPITQTTVKEIYKSLFNEPITQNGEITPTILTKQKLTSHEQQIEKLKEFHVFRNQKLRQTIGEYQNLATFGNLLPEEERLISQENKNLKELIQCICSKTLNQCVKSNEKY